MYEYEAKLIQVHDGDTIHVDVDMGFDMRRKMTLRFAGINAPELPTVEGIAAREYVEAHLSAGKTFLIRTHKDRTEKYGRYLAWVHLGRAWLNQMMVDDGMAIPYGDLPVTPS